MGVPAGLLQSHACLHSLQCFLYVAYYTCFIMLHAHLCTVHSSSLYLLFRLLIFVVDESHEFHERWCLGTTIDLPLTIHCPRVYTHSLRCDAKIAAPACDPMEFPALEPQSHWPRPPCACTSRTTWPQGSTHGQRLHLQADRQIDGQAGRQMGRWADR